MGTTSLSQCSERLAVIGRDDWLTVILKYRNTAFCWKIKNCFHNWRYSYDWQLLVQFFQEYFVLDLWSLILIQNGKSIAISIEEPPPIPIHTSRVSGSLVEKLSTLKRLSEFGTVNFMRKPLCSISWTRFITSLTITSLTSRPTLVDESKVVNFWMVFLIVFFINCFILVLVNTFVQFNKII